MRIPQSNAHGGLPPEEKEQRVRELDRGDSVCLAGAMNPLIAAIIMLPGATPKS